MSKETPHSTASEWHEGKTEVSHTNHCVAKMKQSACPGTKHQVPDRSPDTAVPGTCPVLTDQLRTQSKIPAWRHLPTSTPAPSTFQGQHPPFHQHQTLALSASHQLQLTSLESLVRDGQCTHPTSHHHKQGSGGSGPFYRPQSTLSLVEAQARQHPWSRSRLLASTCSMGG